MLGESNLNNAFTTRIARINKGRVFFANRRVGTVRTGNYLSKPAEKSKLNYIVLFGCGY